ncbi:transposon Tf2-1 polyprotein isoform X1 [Amaranthus tricolor]|uniref:transposon Tf2-1 polyprotein isoform X1 n=1 Tax=Amaranthus tricolor TaxID=29722 RepID=UPI00258340AB|nr:transposon Tf2-1 polyprotein isoform X1 [Amaranthus tricolor]
MLKALVLGFPNFSTPFVVEADASGKGLGVDLSENKHPIAYFSKALGVRCAAKSIYEKELMAIMLAVQKWRHYLIGRHITVWTDQKSLKYILEQREIGAEYQRWAQKLLGYRFDIRFKPRTSNSAADSFSRHPILAILAISGHSWINWDTLLREIAQDSFLIKLIAEVEQNPGVKRGFSVTHGRLVIPHKSSVIETLMTLMREYHNTAIGGHNGEYKNLSSLGRGLVLGRHEETSDSICARMRCLPTTNCIPPVASRIVTASSLTQPSLGRHFYGLRRRDYKIGWLECYFGDRRPTI